MIKLLNANFYRLKKSKILWLVLLFTIFWAIFTLFTKYQSIKKYNSYIEIESLIFNFIYLFSFVITIFTTLFLGDNSDNTTRSRIIIGHKKTHIYLANFITILTVTLTTYSLYTILILIFGKPLIGGITIPFSSFFLKLFNLILTLIAYSSLITFIATTVSDKVIVTILSIILYIILIFTAFLLVSRLSETEYYTSLIYNKETNSYTNIEEKNPLYIPENTKKIIKLVIPLNPFGLSLLITSKENINLNLLPLYSLSLTIISMALTIIFFTKKEFK